MSVYNGGSFLQDAVQSILSQTFGSFELIIINDGSTDDTDEILRKYQRSDNRAAIYDQENRGLIASLNRGFSLAKGKYIARMGADDICDVRRLEMQVAFLDAHPEIGIVGTGVLIVDEHGAVIHRQVMPTHPRLIDWHLAFENCFIHSSVMMRRDVVQALGYYRSGALHAEDYDLWSRARAVTRLTNLPDMLVRRREWGGNICTVHFLEQEHTACIISRSMMEGILGRLMDLETVACARRLLVIRQPPRSMEEVRRIESLVRDLHKAYLVKRSLAADDARVLARDVGLKFAVLAMGALRISPWEGLGLLVKALRLNPGVLSMRTLRRKLARITADIGAAKRQN